MIEHQTHHSALLQRTFDACAARLTALAADATPATPLDRAAYLAMAMSALLCRYGARSDAEVHAAFDALLTLHARPAFAHAALAALGATVEPAVHGRDDPLDHQRHHDRGDERHGDREQVVVLEPGAGDRADRAGVHRPHEGGQQRAGPEQAVRVVHGAGDEVHGGAAEGDVAGRHEEDQGPLAQPVLRGLDRASTLAPAQEAEALPADLVAQEIAEVVPGEGAGPGRQPDQDDRGSSGARPQRGQGHDRRLAGDCREEAVQGGEGVDDEVDPPGVADLEDPVLQDAGQREETIEQLFHGSFRSGVPRPPWGPLRSGTSSRDR